MAPAGGTPTDRLAQLLMNLVTNALKYGQLKPEVVIRTRGQEDEVVLGVHNKGAPIPPDLLPVVFEPMRQGALTQGDRSVGLGLYIVKDLVDAHGGNIAVATSAEEGTAFYGEAASRDSSAPGPAMEAAGATAKSCGARCRWTIAAAARSSLTSVRSFDLAAGGSFGLGADRSP